MSSPGEMNIQRYAFGVTYTCTGRASCHQNKIMHLIKAPTDDIDCVEGDGDFTSVQVNLQSTAQNSLLTTYFLRSGSLKVKLTNLTDSCG